MASEIDDELLPDSHEQEADLLSYFGGVFAATAIIGAIQMYYPPIYPWKLVVLGGIGLLGVLVAAFFVG